MVCELLGCAVDVVSDGNEAIARYDPMRHDLVLCDYVMEPVNGIYVLSKIKEFNPLAKCIVVSGFQDARIRNFVEQNSILDIIVKPIQPQILKESLRLVLNSERCATAELEEVALINRMDECPRLAREDPKVRVLREQLIEHIYAKSVIVLVGPVGSGKREIAAFMHLNGPSAGGGCATIDCSKYTNEEFNSYLIDASGDFGVQVKRAEQGILILRNLDAMPRSVQKLLTEHLDELVDRTQVCILADSPLDAALDRGELDDEFYFKIASNTVEVG